jgi:SNF2 family DNA or RNA helicase
MDVLNEQQQSVIRECLYRADAGISSGGLALPLGFGKTRTSIVLGLSYNCGIVLAVMSKTLMAGWIDEINKAFGSSIPFEVVHGSFLKGNFNTWKPKPETRLVLTTPDVLADAYTNRPDIEARFVNRIVPREFGPTIVEYINPQAPFISTEVSGPSVFFSTAWGCLIVDEIQKFTNIETTKARAISALHAHYRWGLSGTMFDEPKIERFLGYFVILNIAGPRTKPAMREYITSSSFGGFDIHLVKRAKPMLKGVKYTEKVIVHDLDDHEFAIFDAMRVVMREIAARVNVARRAGDVDSARTFGAYLLATITYIRQTLVCPIIPITSMYCDMADIKNRSELSQIATQKFSELDLNGYLSDPRNIYSSRFREIIKLVDKHIDGRVLIFSCFRTSIDVLKYILDEKGVNTMTITSSMSIAARRSVIERFDSADRAVMLLTYDLGAEGLNLQSSSTAILTDMWWNSAKIQQSIGRIYRQGQRASEVFIYMLVSNTGIEQQLIRKNQIKAACLKQLQTGSCKIKIPKLKVDEIVAMIDSDANKSDLLAFRKVVSS